MTEFLGLLLAVGEFTTNVIALGVILGLVRDWSVNKDGFLRRTARNPAGRLLVGAPFVIAFIVFNDWMWRGLTVSAREYAVLLAGG